MAEREEIKAAVKEAMVEMHRDFWIPSEEHYKQHQFLADLMRWSDKAKGSICSSAAKALVAGLLMLLLYGFAFFWRVNKL